MDYLVVRFDDRPIPNETHPLIAQFSKVGWEIKQPQKPQKPYQPLTQQTSNVRVLELTQQYEGFFIAVAWLRRIAIWISVPVTSTR